MNADIYVCFWALHCVVFQKYYWYIILWLHHLRQQENINKTDNADTTNSALTFAKLHFKWQHFFLYFSVAFASLIYRNINVFSTNPTPIFGLFQGVLTALL